MTGSTDKEIAARDPADRDLAGRDPADRDLAGSGPAPGQAAPPIVIIGAARSGTKILRDVLAAAPGARAVPYDVNYVWRYGAPETHDVQDPDTLTPARRRFIPATLRSLARIGPGDGRTRLIEKSVSNGLRVPFVAALLPGAHFVHLVRDGRDVTESAMRLWQAPPDWGALKTKLRDIPLANLGYVAWFGWNTLRGMLSGRKGGRVWGPRYPGIFEDAERLPLAAVCARQWRETVARARTALADLPPAQVTEIRYEDLVRDPAALDRLIADTGLDRDPDDAAAIRAAWSASVRADMGGKWRALAPEDRDLMLETIGPLLSELGYEETEHA